MLRRQAMSLLCKGLASVAVALPALVGCSKKTEEKEPCHPKAVYGPQPCHSDTDCEKRDGKGWYCDKDHAYDNGCGKKAKWPLCRQREQAR